MIGIIILIFVIVAIVVFLTEITSNQATTATFVPIMYNFNKKALFTSQVVNIGVQLGAQSYVAGIAGPSMFSNLDKDTFAKVQAVLFPRQVF